MTRIAILISGRGSNMQSLVAAARAGRVSAEVVLVLSNRDDAAGLQWARAQGIPTAVLKHRDYPDREAYDHALVERLRAAQAEWVCLAGFMRLLGPTFCQAFPERVLNIHPSLLPAFPGLDAQAQALQYGVRVTGATVHFVTPELDAGPIVAQAAVQVLETDTVEHLAARVLAVEHELYPAALAAVLQDEWRIEGRRVVGLRGSPLV